MRKNSIKWLDNMEVNKVTFEDVVLSDCVNDVVCLGRHVGKHFTKCYWEIELEDFSKIKVWTK